MMNENEIMHWLLGRDVSLQYQVYRDLLGEERIELRDRIAKEGWGYEFLSRNKPDGQWGLRFYQPKWTSTHYTLLDLRNLDLAPGNQIAGKAIDRVLETGKAQDGGIRLGPSTAHHSDVCVNGMFLNYASHFHAAEKKLHSLVDCILDEIMPDGGFNCRSTRSGARHSSLHTTISVLAGLFEFRNSGFTYREGEIRDALASAVEFILIHRLFLSDRTGNIIHKDFLKMPWPMPLKHLKRKKYVPERPHPENDRDACGIKAMKRPSKP